MTKVHYNGNAYGTDGHTDTLTLIIGFVAILTFAVLTCRVMTCRRFDHELTCCNVCFYISLFSSAMGWDVGQYITNKIK